MMFGVNVIGVGSCVVTAAVCMVAGVKVGQLGEVAGVLTVR